MALTFHVHAFLSPSMTLSLSSLMGAQNNHMVITSQASCNHLPIHSSFEFGWVRSNLKLKLWQIHEIHVDCPVTGEGQRAVGVVGHLWEALKKKL